MVSKWSKRWCLKKSQSVILIFWCFFFLREVEGSAEISRGETDAPSAAAAARWTLVPSESSFTASSSSSSSSSSSAATKESAADGDSFEEHQQAQALSSRPSTADERHWTAWKQSLGGPSKQAEEAAYENVVVHHLNPNVGGGEEISVESDVNSNLRDHNNDYQMQGDEPAFQKPRGIGFGSVNPTKLVKQFTSTSGQSAQQQQQQATPVVLSSGKPTTFVKTTSETATGGGAGASSATVEPTAPGKSGDVGVGGAASTAESPRSAPNKFEDKGDQEEKLLLYYLMQGYEKDVRPVRNASKPVVIEVGITLTQIFDMDEKNQVLTTNVWLDQEWYDDFLKWNPADFGGLEMVRLPCHRIWLPDIVLYNNADDYTQGYMPSRAMVSSEGKVFWPPPTKFRSTCPVDVTYFPFDDQRCTLKLGSWTYNGFQVDVMNRTTEVDLSNYVANGEWELLQAELQRNVVTYSCCPEPFPDVTITLTIRRKTLYYIYNVVLPCVMLSVLTLLVFCLPPDSGEKIALGITVLLAFSVFMLAIAEKMPETSESIPLIGIYLTAVMAITSISVIVTVVVLNLHYLGPQVRPVPKWLRRFLPSDHRENTRGSTSTTSLGYRIRQKSWLIPPNHREPRSGSLKRSHVPLPPDRSGGNHTDFGGPAVITSPSVTAQPSSYLNELKGHNASTNHVASGGLYRRHARPLQQQLSAKSSKNGIDEALASAQPLIHQHPQQQPQHPHHHPLTQTESLREGDSPLLGTISASGGLQSIELPTDQNVQTDLLHSIQTLISRQEEVEGQNLLVAEWRLVAQTIDKILFWIFLTVTLVSSAVFLLILPFYKRSFFGPYPR